MCKLQEVESPPPQKKILNSFHFDNLGIIIMAPVCKSFECYSALQTFFNPWLLSYFQVVILSDLLFPLFCYLSTDVSEAHSGR